MTSPDSKPTPSIASVEAALYTGVSSTYPIQIELEYGDDGTASLDAGVLLRLIRDTPGALSEKKLLIYPPLYPTRVMAEGASDYTRRAIAREVTTLADEAIVIDDSQHQVFVDGKPVHFPDKDYETLRLLAVRAGNIVTHDMFIAHIWANKPRPNRNVINTHINRVRGFLGHEKLGHPKDGAIITCGTAGWIGRLTLDQSKTL